MPYELILHFNPDFDHTRLKPTENKNGSVDHYNLQYVQNAVMHQVLAELRPLTPERAAGLNPRFVLQEPCLPAGPNTAVNPQDPTQLLAATNGYVRIDDGLVHVKKTLNVRHDVDFHTGNILFVGDLVVHGSVRAGFDLKARNILVKELVEGAALDAQLSILAEGGIKGGKTAVLHAGKSLRTPFCENATILAGENLVIDGHCMHSDLYVGHQAVIKGRLHGGHLHCHHVAYVQEKIGGGSTTTTAITLGRDPALSRKLNELELAQSTLKIRVEYYTAQVAKGGELVQEFGPKLEAGHKKQAVLARQLEKTRRQLDATAADATCKLLAPGEVRPGVEITIGNTTLKVDDYYRDVRFSLQGDTIVAASPAMKTK